MGSKVIIFVDGCGDSFDVPNVHANTPGHPSGEGTLCAIMYCDAVWDNGKTKDGRVVYEITDKKIDCPQCIHILESLANYKKFRGDWT